MKSAPLSREVEAERWTRLDAAIRMAADDLGFIDLRPIRARAIRRLAVLAVGRLSRLEHNGLATATGPGQWMIAPEAEPVLRDLGVRGDIINTMRTRSGSWHRRLRD